MSRVKLKAQGNIILWYFLLLLSMTSVLMLPYGSTEYVSLLYVLLMVNIVGDSILAYKAYKLVKGRTKSLLDMKMIIVPLTTAATFFVFVIATLVWLLRNL